MPFRLSEARLRPGRNDLPIGRLRYFAERPCGNYPIPMHPADHRNPRLLDRRSHPPRLRPLLARDLPRQLPDPRDVAKGGGEEGGEQEGISTPTVQSAIADFIAGALLIVPKMKLLSRAMGIGCSSQTCVLP